MILTTRRRLLGDTSKQASVCTTGSKMRSFHQEQTQTPPPPTTPPGHLAGLRAQQQILLSSTQHSRNVLPAGFPLCQGTPTPRSASDTPTPTLAPGDGSRTQSALPHPHLRDTHTTHPWPQGEARGENPCIPRGSSPERGRGEAGWAPARELTGAAVAQPRPLRRASGGRFARRKESPSFAHGGPPQVGLPPRQDPGRNGNNEKPPSPAIPAPESGRGRRRHLLSHPRGYTPAPSAPAPARPSAARSPAELTRGRACRARAPSPPRVLASPAPAPTRLRAPRPERDSGTSRRRRRTIWRARSPQWRAREIQQGPPAFMRPEGSRAWPARREWREGAAEGRGRRRGSGRARRGVPAARGGALPRAAGSPSRRSRPRRPAPRRFSAGRHAPATPDDGRRHLVPGVLSSEPPAPACAPHCASLARCCSKAWTPARP